jgi:hypothetical protein
MERLGPLMGDGCREPVVPAAPRWRPASSLLYISPGTKSRFPRDVLGRTTARPNVVPGRQIKFQSEKHHGRSLSRHRRYWRERPYRDGADYRHDLKGRLGGAGIDVMFRGSVVVWGSDDHGEQELFRASGGDTYQVCPVNFRPPARGCLGGKGG